VLREDADLQLKLCCLPSSSFFKYLEYPSMLSLFLLFLSYFTANFFLNYYWHILNSGNKIFTVLLNMSA